MMMMMMMMMMMKEMGNLSFRCLNHEIMKSLSSLTRPMAVSLNLISTTSLSLFQRFRQGNQ